MRNKKPITKKDINRQGTFNLFLGLAVWVILVLIFRYF